MENRKWNAEIEDGSLASRLMGDWITKPRTQVLRDWNNEPGRWTVWYNHEDENRKTIVIDGNRFSDLEGFYNEIDLLFRNNPGRQISHNLSTLNDLLRGGSKVMKFEEPITLVWKNSEKSSKDLGLRSLNRWAIGESFFEVLVGIIGEHRHIELSLE